ncbi:hypothetical protein LX36DRAFT_656083 [Colletotrichum falcatum]|nr:hypothetical protein LX36DRAFT_656083 [Colletotrichum falcatum]
MWASSEWTTDMEMEWVGGRVGKAQARPGQPRGGGGGEGGRQPVCSPRQPVPVQGTVTTTTTTGTTPTVTTGRVNTVHTHPPKGDRSPRTGRSRKQQGHGQLPVYSYYS